MIKKTSLFLVCGFLLSLNVGQVSANTDAVLATVGDIGITANELEQALVSAPFATSFASMPVKRQAKVRGDMLIRLVDSELLRQEAVARGIDQLPDFKQEIINFRTGLLFQAYSLTIGNNIAIPADISKSLKEKYKGQPDALAAARSVYTSSQYKAAKAKAFLDLRTQGNVIIYRDRLSHSPKDDTLLAKGNDFKIFFSDIKNGSLGVDTVDSVKQQAKRLDDFIDILLGAHEAKRQKINVESQVAQYRKDLLRKVLIDQLEKEWIPSGSELSDYYKAHPEIGKISELRNIGQIVLATEKEANSVRSRIIKGENFFKLAKELTIDPIAKKNSGEMGWLKKGSGLPALESALEGLPLDQVSKVVKTDRGYHLLIIMDKKEGRQQPLAEIHDRVRQALISEKSSALLLKLAKKYPIKLQLADHKGG